MAWDADSLNKLAGALNAAYSPDQVFRALDFTGHAGRECGEHRSTGPRAWCHGCSEWCSPEGPCKGCELPQLRARVDALEALADVVREVLPTVPAAPGWPQRRLGEALAALDARSAGQS
jgi:hypothetical protein